MKTRPDCDKSSSTLGCCSTPRRLPLERGVCFSMWRMYPCAQSGFSGAVGSCPAVLFARSLVTPVETTSEHFNEFTPQLLPLHAFKCTQSTESIASVICTYFHRCLASCCTHRVVMICLIGFQNLNSDTSFEFLFTPHPPPPNMIFTRLISQNDLEDFCQNAKLKLQMQRIALVCIL